MFNDQVIKLHIRKIMSNQILHWQYLRSCAQINLWGK